MKTKKDITKDKILSSAKKLYKEYNYSGTSLQMIADEAKVSKSLLVYYFKQKNMILTTLTNNYLNDITAFIKNIVADDPLLIMMAAYTIFFENIFKDEQTKKFWHAIMNRNDRTIISYNNSDNIYLPVWKKYNDILNEDEFMCKKIQILGADREISYAYYKDIYVSTDEEYIKQSIILKSTILGVDRLTILNYLSKCNGLLEHLDYSRFELLN